MINKIVIVQKAISTHVFLNRARRKTETKFYNFLIFTDTRFHLHLSAPRLRLKTSKITSKRQVFPSTVIIIIIEFIHSTMKITNHILITVPEKPKGA